jgi:hypothetical protein
MSPLIAARKMPSNNGSFILSTPKFTSPSKSPKLGKEGYNIILEDFGFFGIFTLNLTH